MPNIFTPNGDSKNDEFFLETECDLKKFHLSLYNRYGQVVFESFDINFRWNGRNGGRALSEGVYFYILEYETEFSEKFQKKGSVQLFK
jgi:gliding motility-associated-like protein